MVCLKDPLVQKVCELYEKISKLDNLNPSNDVDTLFTQLVRTCIPPHPIDVTKLCAQIQDMRTKLIKLCGYAESLLEKHFSTILGSFDKPLDRLDLFPYYSNYLKLSRLEFDLLAQHCPNPTRIAFVGSGPLPLTSIVLASHHLKSSVFHNFDIDASANSMASKLIEPHPDLSQRMAFYTNDIMDVPGDALKEYDVVFLAALVGMDVEEKMHVIEHLAKNMAPGAILMLRSAHGARAFLYPVVEPRHLRGFEVLSVFHPTDEVINSVVVARRCPKPVHNSIEQVFGPMMLCSKCAETQSFNPLNLIEELAVEDHLC
ncbi:Nicotianamine synthase [Handroanthus impetiginosus]|uniref:Nicotianamine synthase n=1 Tax=Handroanthus impetiginosus TaxID=429701 RepID=A0A2G9G8H9_9LAMI|nr:Nicotianamine synthase [Handroanthus impetiginosus]